VARVNTDALPTNKTACHTVACLEEVTEFFFFSREGEWGGVGVRAYVATSVFTNFNSLSPESSSGGHNVKPTAPSSTMKVSARIHGEWLQIPCRDGKSLQMGVFYVKETDIDVLIRN